MSTFTTADRLSHHVTITVGALTDVKRQTGVDLGKVLVDETALAELLFSDPARLVSVLYVLTGAKDPDAFAHGFDGPALERGTEALLGAIADFFPRSRVAKAIRERMAGILERLDALILEKMTPTS